MAQSSSEQATTFRRTIILASWWTHRREARPEKGSEPVSLAPNKELWNWDSIAPMWTWYNSNVSKDLKTNPAIEAKLEEGTSTIGRDNVGCFLSYMHYDAVVPGKHDFYYGPERLRQLARFMASIPMQGDTNFNPNFTPVQMLAANMMIKTTWAKDHAPIPDGGKRPLPFVTKYVQTAKLDKNKKPISLGDLKIEDFTDVGFAFPWMQFIRVTATGWSDSDDLKHRLQVFLCEAAPGDPDDFLKRDGLCYNQHLLGQTQGPPRRPTTRSKTRRMRRGHRRSREYRPTRNNYFHNRSCTE